MAQSHLLRSPQDMPTICRTLKLREDGQVFRSFVDAILRATGYHKPHLTYRGRVTAREYKADGTTPFASDFKAMVSRFLDACKVGALCFPRFDLLPIAEGWRDGSSHTDFFETLEWMLVKDRKIIEEGALLLFEYLQSHPYVVEEPVTNRIIWDEMDGPCYDCGGDCTDGNDIIYCHRCWRGWHEDCGKIWDVPEDGWYCNDCEISEGFASADQSSASLVESSIDAPEIETDLILPKLWAGQWDNTILLVSYDRSRKQRVINASMITDMDSLFILCEQLWNIQISHIVVQTIPHSEQALELTKDGEFEALVGYVDNAWGDEITGTVYISIHLREQ